MTSNNSAPNVFDLDPDDRVAVFIDGSNMFAASKALGFNTDYSAVLRCLKQNCRLIRASYYTAIDENPEYTSLRPLIDWLDYNGFNIISKPTKEFTDALGRRKVKGNMDIEIAVDMLQAAHRQKLDRVVLFSGDGDFSSLLLAVAGEGIKTTVVSTLATKPPMASDELRRTTDHFIDLDAIKDYIKQVRLVPLQQEPRSIRDRESAHG